MNRGPFCPPSLDRSRPRPGPRRLTCLPNTGKLPWRRQHQPRHHQFPTHSRFFPRARPGTELPRASDFLSSRAWQGSEFPPQPQCHRGPLGPLCPHSTAQWAQAGQESKRRSKRNREMRSRNPGAGGGRGPGRSPFRVTGREITGRAGITGD